MTVKPLQSPPEALAKIDNRRVEARIMAKIEADLTRHCGGSPSITQQILINRLAWLGLHLAQLDKKASTAGSLCDGEAKRYLGWSNSFIRGVRHLGLKGAAERAPTFSDVVAKIAAAKAASAQVPPAASSQPSRADDSPARSLALCDEAAAS
jgi:hypothetical protein